MVVLLRPCYSKPLVIVLKHKPFVARILEVCNDVELNPGPKTSQASPAKKSTVNKNQNNNMNSQNSVQENSRDSMPANDVPRIKKLGNF